MNCGGSMLKYWSNAFMTTGSAVLATAIFTDYVESGLLIGGLGIFLGAWLHGLSISTQKEGKR